MKNMHIIPTENYSDLVHSTNKYGGYFLSRHYSPMKNMGDSYQNIYITNDEEIKEGDWYLDTFNTQRIKANQFSDHKHYGNACKKIILTTDQDLIKDGVQAIDDDFLEWFVKNPSCDEVPIITTIVLNEATHKTNIGFENWRKEEPKQETLEEASERLAKKYGYDIEGGAVADFVDGVVRGANLQAKRMYSEKEVRKIAEEVRWQAIGNPLEFTKNFEKWFEQFKKK